MYTSHFLSKHHLYCEFCTLNQVCSHGHCRSKTPFKLHLSCGGRGLCLYINNILNKITDILENDRRNYRVFLRSFIFKITSCYIVVFISTFGVLPINNVNMFIFVSELSSKLVTEKDYKNPLIHPAINLR